MYIFAAWFTLLLFTSKVKVDGQRRKNVARSAEVVGAILNEGFLMHLPSRIVQEAHLLIFSLSLYSVCVCVCVLFFWLFLSAKLA